MSPVGKADQELDNVIRELTMRIVVPRMGEFDDVWDIANRVCDRYGLAKPCQDEKHAA
jgi:hypothetical protein